MKHILVLRSSALGDVAIAAPVLYALSQQYPDVRITILTKGLYTPIFSHINNLQVFPIDTKGRHKGFFGIIRLFRELKVLRPDAVADLHNVLRTNILKPLFLAIGIPFKQLDKGREQKRELTRPQNKIFTQLKPTYQRYADVFQSLGYNIKLSSEYFAPKRKLSQGIARLFIPNKKYIGIAPFAAHPAKQYSFQNIKNIVNTLRQNPNNEIFIFGGGEKEQHLADSLNCTENVHNVVGRFSFDKELEIISNLSVMLSMDSGNAHLSALFGVKTITLWGITHPYAGFYPYGQPSQNALLADRQKYPLIPTSVFGHKCPEGYQDAINSISIDNIISLLQS